VFAVDYDSIIAPKWLRIVLVFTILRNLIIIGSFTVDAETIKDRMFRLRIGDLQIFIHGMSKSQRRHTTVQSKVSPSSSENCF